MTFAKLYPIYSTVSVLAAEHKIFPDLLNCNYLVIYVAEIHFFTCSLNLFVDFYTFNV